MIDMSKKYRLRGGDEAKVYAVYGSEKGGVVHGAYKLVEEWQIMVWHENGSYYRDRESTLDLIEVKPERWYPIWACTNGQDYFLSGDPSDSKEQAMSRRNRHNHLPVGAWKAPE